MSGQKPSRICTGFEHGLLDKTGGGLVSDFTGTTAISAAALRTGNYGLRVQPTSAPSPAWVLLAATGGTLLTSEKVQGRFYFKFNTAVPNADMNLAGLGGASAAQSFGLAFNAATSKIRAFKYEGGPRVLSFDTDGPAVVADTWYRVDWKEISGGGSLTYRLDGGTEFVYTHSAFGVAGFIMGNQQGGAADADIFFDDVVVNSWTEADDTTRVPVYPIGEGQVVLLSPSAEGTHVNSADFRDDAATSPPGTPQTRLDEIPPSPTDTDYIQQYVADVTAYIEMLLQDMPAACIINGVVFRWGWHNEAAGAAVDYLRYVDTVNGEVSITFTTSSLTKIWEQERIDRSAGQASLTSADINSLLLRYGFQAGVPELNRLRDVHVEVDYVPVSDNDGWGWGDGQERWSYI